MINLNILLFLFYFLMAFVALRNIDRFLDLWENEDPNFWAILAIQVGTFFFMAYKLIACWRFI